MSKNSIIILLSLTVGLAAAFILRKGRFVMEKRYTINFDFDEKDGAWIATSDDIWGLVLEDEDLDELKKRVRIAVLMLLELEKESLNLVYNVREKTVVA